MYLCYEYQVRSHVDQNKSTVNCNCNNKNSVDEAKLKCTNYINEHKFLKSQKKDCKSFRV